MLTHAQKIILFSDTFLGTASKLLGTFASVGDSRLAQMFADSTTTQTAANARMFFNQANARLGHSMTSTYNGAVSGYRADQYLPFLSTALATAANFVMIWGTLNDVTGNGGSAPQTADQSWFGWTAGNGPSGASSTSIGIKAACDQVLAAGKTLILIGEPGSTSTFGNSTYTGYIDQYNAYAQAYCASHPRALYFDAPATLLSGGTFPAGWTDGTHTLTLGAYYLGKAFQTFITPYIKQLSLQMQSAGDLLGGAAQYLSNPFFLTTTGGTANTGVTGPVPAGLSVFIDTGGSVVVTTAANPLGYGNDAIFTCTFSASGQRVTIRWDLNAGTPVAGDVHQDGVNVSVDAGSVNFAGVYLQELMQVNSTNTQAYDCFLDQTFGAGPTEAYSQFLMTRPITAPSGMTTWNQVVRGYSTGAGSAVFRLSRDWMRKN
jgi:hypothetical protein